MRSNSDIPQRRGVLPTEGVVAYARDLISELGVRGAAKTLALSRTATLALAAGAPVDRGTLALAERAIEAAEGGKP